MVRPRVAVSLLLFSAVGMAAAGIQPTVSVRLLLVFLLTSVWYINATSINDLSDYKIDLINLKGSSERPLINKRVDRKGLINLSIVSAVVAILIAVSLDFKIALATSVVLVLNYIYSMPPIRISYRGFLAVLLLPLGYVVFPFLVGAWAQTDRLTVKTLWLLIALYVSFMGRIVLKDFRDVEGDAKFGKLTFLLRYGKRTTCILSACALSAGTLIIVLTFGKPFFAYCLLVYLGLALWSLNLLLNAPRKELEMVSIAGVVRSASGAVLSILATLLMRIQNLPQLNQRLVYIALITLFTAFVVDTLKPLQVKDQKQWV